MQELGIARVVLTRLTATGALERVGRGVYRLGRSAHADHFVLKGAMLFNLWYAMPHRPTRDMDLLGFGPSDLQSIGQSS